MKKQICISTAMFLLLSASVAFPAEENSSKGTDKEKKENTSFESCGKDSGKGCGKEAKGKFKGKKYIIREKKVKPGAQK